MSKQALSNNRSNPMTTSRINTLTTSPLLLVVSALVASACNPITPIVLDTAVDNVAPEVQAWVSPAQAEPGDTLTCSAVVTDADNDATEVVYEWSNGAFGETLVVSGDAQDGDVLACTVSATDPSGDVGVGLATATVSLTEPDPDPEPEPEPEPACGSLYFDGTALVEVPTSSAFPSGDEARTVMLWTRADTRSTVNLVTFGSGRTTNARWSILLEQHALKLVGQNNDYFFDDRVGSDWIHVAMSYDGDSLSFYEDGELTEVVEVTTAFNTDNTFEMIIGSDSLDRNDEFFEGNIADLRVWSRALSARQIEAEYDSYEASTSALVGHWPLNEGEGRGVDDISGNGHDGIISGAQWTNDCP